MKRINHCKIYYVSHVIIIMACDYDYQNLTLILNVKVFVNFMTNNIAFHYWGYCKVPYLLCL